MSLFSDVSQLVQLVRRQTVMVADLRLAVSTIATTLAQQQQTLVSLATRLDQHTDLLKAIRDALVPKPAAAIRFDAVINGKVEVGIMAFQLQDIQSVALSLVFVDADGNPTSAPGVTPVWDTSDASKIAVTPAPDGMSAVASGQSVLGDAQINVTAGALTGQLAVTVVAGPPASIQIVPGAVTPATARR